MSNKIFLKSLPSKYLSYLKPTTEMYGSSNVVFNFKYKHLLEAKLISLVISSVWRLMVIWGRRAGEDFHLTVDLQNIQQFLLSEIVFFISDRIK